ncbi:hypothetical protein KM043_017383 [Ampulex compressa]|nr:hypothetical protein KM043_017383 [Ampulex compressa]
MKRLFLGLVCVILFFILRISTDSDLLYRISPFLDAADYSDITCYSEEINNGGITDIDHDSELEKLIPGRNIFFHETSCFGNDNLVLNARQACAVESAAKMNPNANVYLLFVSPGNISQESKTILGQLMSYPNVKIRHLYPTTYFKTTPLERWYASGALKKSRWPRSHMSDVLRYITLWKYGGIYLDLDVVVVKSLEGLTNFAGAEDWENVAAGVIGFDVTGMGRQVANACLRDLKKNFRGYIWGNNGPGVITRTLQKFCSTKYAQNMTTARCHGFRVFPPTAFYPVHYKKWRKYFDIKDRNATMKSLENSMVIHLWNKLSQAEQVDVDSDVPYAAIARKYCPEVFSNCGKVF